MPEPVAAFVALGSNLDDPRAQVERGFDALAALPDTRLRARSRLFRTPPWGVVDQPDFINAVAELETSLSPRELLEALLGIETRAGRVRGVPNGPRVLDLDLLLYANAGIREPGLVVPHPRLIERAFVLAPLADIAADRVVPGQGRVTDLLQHVDVSGCLPLD
ncbi:MAG: 2-amino-4-hydroxy-6-hydroxymethyldihydropteridine pyrophosphokinase [Rhodanobacteraceae bacterium]|jgi:2-amino-4-hydroxy-6-hydroxymethyldihydropteridine diphosphokinase|nr:MAG: 2-amino-4-hydroxy-6-hydroxymethyldihydropteridine pyrophosphokinase [Rhodanobacteraceae bacterium]